METTKTESVAGAPIIIRSKDRVEWLIHRRGGIGSSDVASILGLNPYETPYQAWMRFRGMSPHKEETQAMKMGHLLEPIVATLFVEATGAQIDPESIGDVIYIDPERKHFRASPDRIYTMDETQGILECKSTRLSVSTEDVPRSWMAQLQYQMMVTGIHSGHIAWLKDGRDFGFVPLVYSPEFGEWMREEVERFYIDCVIGDQQPDPYSGQDIALRYPRHEEGLILQADENALRTWERATEVKASIKALESEYQALTDSLKLTLGAHEALEYAGKTLCTYKAGKDRTTFDGKRFQAEHPEIAEAYLSSQRASRTLLIK